MKTRIYLSIITLTAIAYTGHAAPKERQKPNIIFILTDDQRWNALGFAGNEIIHTPEMDRMAREGMYFKNAFATTPICAASRASILTGLYERTHGYTFQQESVKEEFMKASYPMIMKSSEYYTGFFGKSGVIYPNFNSLFNVCEDYDRESGKGSRGYFYKEIGGEVVHLTRYTGQKALDFIDSAPKGNPFCLSLSFSAPHAHDPAVDQYFWGSDVDSLYNDVTIPPPILGEDKYFNALPEYVKNGESRKRWTWRFDTPDKYQKSVKGYYRMISEIDLEIGKIRKKLQEKGLDDNTVIILASDNGYFLGDRQLADKWLMYDTSIRILYMIYDPRNKVPKQINEMALNIDIPATILGYAGLKIPKQYQGKNLAGFSKGDQALKSRKDFICEHLWRIDTTSSKLIIEPSEGIRTTKWKYFRYIKDMAREELYNLEVDPLEKVNLISDEKYRPVLNGLREKFLLKTTEMKLLKDQLLSNEILKK